MWRHCYSHVCCVVSCADDPDLSSKLDEVMKFYRSVGVCSGDDCRRLVMQVRRTRRLVMQVRRLSPRHHAGASSLATSTQQRYAVCHKRCPKIPQNIMTLWVYMYVLNEPVRKRVLCTCTRSSCFGYTCTCMSIIPTMRSDLTCLP